METGGQRYRSPLQHFLLVLDLGPHLPYVLINLGCALSRAVSLQTVGSSHRCYYLIIFSQGYLHSSLLGWYTTYSRLQAVLFPTMYFMYDALLFNTNLIDFDFYKIHPLLVCTTPLVPFDTELMLLRV